MPARTSIQRTSYTSYIDVILSATHVRWKIMSRYPGYTLIEIVLPLITTALPLLLGGSLQGSASGIRAFAKNAGTIQYQAYLLLGSITLLLVSSTLRSVALWIYREQYIGTLEATYMAPVPHACLLLGVALYSNIRSLITLSISFIAGCILFKIDPFQGNIPLALSFLAFGTIALYGMSLLFGAIILRFKEANAILQIAQWLVILLMGAYFPIQVFPPSLRWIALASPPTWMINGTRAALLNTSWFSGSWYGDLLIMMLFAIITPLIGHAIFIRLEKNLRAHQGLGTF